MQRILFVQPDSRGRVSLGKVIDRSKGYKVVFDPRTGSILLEPVTLTPDAAPASGRD